MNTLITITSIGLFILGVLAMLWWVASTQTDGMMIDESDPLITPPVDDEDKE